MRLIHVLAALTALATSGAALALPEETRQLVLVITADWNASHGTLYSFERTQGPWRSRALDVPVSIGAAGAAWGLGLHEPQPGLQKAEGDRRSPAGMFSIGTAFGYEPRVQTDLPYRAMNEFDYCIDVEASPLYNRIVDARAVGRGAVVGSTEPMRRDIHVKGDQLYKVGFVIEHNPDHVSAKGSCVFAHVWRAAGHTTAGCTAMKEEALRELLAWLDDDAHPVLVLLPRADYQRLRGSWQLPDLASSARYPNRKCTFRNSSMQVGSAGFGFPSRPSS